jgi:uncharacterized protein YjbI with pentapeptide repeats
VNCDFSNADFSENDFIDCRFESCNFAVAKLNGSGLKNVYFNSCKLVGIDFEHCSDFLFAADFKNCVLDYASFFKKRMKNARFINCSMKEVDFSSADLSGALFGNCDLSMAVFSQCNLEKTDFRTAFNYAFDPGANKMKKAKFSNSGLAGLLGKYNIEIE